MPTSPRTFDENTHQICFLQRYLIAIHTWAIVKEGTSEGFVETQPGFVRFFSSDRPGNLDEMLSKEQFEVVKSYQDRKDGTTWSNIFARSLQ